MVTSTLAECELYADNGFEVILLYKVLRFFLSVAKDLGNRRADPKWFFFTLNLVIGPDKVFDYFEGNKKSPSPPPKKR